VVGGEWTELESIETIEEEIEIDRVSQSRAGEHKMATLSRQLRRVH
jgi:hypothetical protein